MQKVIKNTDLEPISTDILKLDNEIVPGSYDVPTTHAVAEAIDGVVPLNSYTALAANTTLPLKVDTNGNLTNNGTNLNASGTSAWAEGVFTESSGYASHAEGESSISTSHASHAEGRGTESSGFATHAEGLFTKASATGAHAEGNSTEAAEQNAHAEGNYTKATGQNAHAEGNYTKAVGKHSHAEGSASEANGDRSHAGGNNCLANGADSFAHGNELKTTSDRCAVFGSFNSDEAAYFLVGNGTDDNNRKNAFKVDKNGDLWGNVNGTIANISKTIYNGSGGDITEVPPQQVYTPGQLYIINGLLMRCVSYTVSEAEFVVTSLIEELNNNE